MKKKNGLKTAHWILLVITAASLAIGLIICLVSKVEFDKLFPIIISAVGLVATIVLDGIGAKHEKIKAKNIVEHAKVGGDARIGGKGTPNSGSSENRAVDISVKGNLRVGEEYK